MKIKVEAGLQMSYLIWSGSTPKALLCHIQLAHGEIEKKGCFMAYEKAIKSIKRFQEIAKEAKDLISATSPIDAAVKKSLERNLNGYKMINKNMTVRAKKAVSKMLNLYGNLQSEERRLQWEG